MKKHKDIDRRRTIWQILLDHEQEIEVIKKRQPPLVETCEGDCTPLQKIWGQWPGDETIEELLDALKDGESVGRT